MNSTRTLVHLEKNGYSFIFYASVKTFYKDVFKDYKLSIFPELYFNLLFPYEEVVDYE